MKKYAFTLLIFLILGLQPGFSQMAEKQGDLLLIREDKVMPSRAETYELALLDLTAFFEANNEKDINYLTHIQDNYHYWHISTIDQLNDYNTGIQEYISGEKNSDEFNLIWSVLTETVYSYKSFVVAYDEINSYVPDETDWLDGRPYRKWNFYYFNPGTSAEVEKILAAWKILYEEHDIQSGYRIYKGILGIDQPVVIFTTWAKNPGSHHKELNVNSQLLGEEGSALLLGMLELSSRVETVEGYYVPGFSYQGE